MESISSSIQISCGKLDTELKAACASMDKKQIPSLLFSKDPSLWKKDPRQVKEISERLGWLSIPDHFEKQSEALVSFAATIKKEGYTHAVLLGMGGSSLCSEVARMTFGSTAGYPQLLVLDNTDPAAILELEKKINLGKALFIVASKSGNTEETLSFFHYFYSELEKQKADKPGNNFVAITDDGTPLVKIAAQYKFRKVFLNQPDLGGRYSVLSDFGLVPMALMGIDIQALLSSARQMESKSKGVSAASSPSISLGILLGICQQHGRDKITFVLSSAITSFGYWVEQLLAESTGKEGRGLIPVNGEPVGTPEVYGKDRLFIHLFLASDSNEDDKTKISALEKAGHPVVRIQIPDKFALGGEYYRWEVAVAVAGIIIGINSFDQPNVEESKMNTKQLLEKWKDHGAFNEPLPLLTSNDISIYAGKQAKGLSGTESAAAFVSSFIAVSKPPDYVAFLPYFLMTDSRVKQLQAWRQEVRDQTKSATTLLNGPRYLHSTGQLHKGGPNTGLYLILIGEEELDLPIPGEKFGFGILHQAQALGDFRSLDDKRRRVIRIHLGKDIDTNLDKLCQMMKDSRKLQFQGRIS